MKRFDTILFATDFTEYSDHALDTALTLARSFDARLIIIHVISSPIGMSGLYAPEISYVELERDIEEWAEQRMQEFRRTRLKDFGNYETVIGRGVPYEQILRTAEKEQVSLIVIGTHGRTGLDRVLFGSTASRVVRRAACPVMTVRASEEGAAQHS